MDAVPRQQPDSKDATTDDPPDWLRSGVQPSTPAPILRYVPRACVIFGLLAVAGLWALIGFGLRALERADEDAANRVLANLARSFEGHVERSLLNIDQILTVAAQSAARNGMPENLAEVLGHQLRDDALFDHVAVVDAKGEVHARIGRGIAGNVADEAYFKVQRERPDGGLYIGRPMPGRTPQVASIPLSVRIARPDGSFAGVAVAAVGSDYFTGFYAGFDLGRDGGVALVGLDGIVRARYVAGAEPEAGHGAIDRAFASPELRRRAEQEAAGNYREASPVDGIRRLYAYRVMAHFPMVVVVGMTERHAFAEFYAQRRTLLLFGSVVSIVILLLTAVLYRQSARLYQAELDASQALAQVRLNAKVFEESSDGIMITDADNRIVAVNRAFSEITRYPASEVIGRNPRFLSSGATPREAYMTMWQSLQRDGSWEGEVVNRRRDGETYPEWLSINVVRDAAGVITHFIGIFSDATARRYDQRRLHFVVHYDALTELPNRLLLFDRLKQAIAVAKREGGGVAVLFLDLDNFKAINDSHGHDVGDRYLQAVARRWRAALRESDTLARLGGDEFILVVSDVDCHGYAERVAAKCHEVFTEPFLFDGVAVFGSVSIGIALYPGDGEDGQALVIAADRAMYRSKHQGRQAGRHRRPDTLH